MIDLDGLIIRQPYADMIIRGRKKREYRNIKPPKSKINRNLFLLSEGVVLGIIKITEYKAVKRFRSKNHSFAQDRSMSIKDNPTFIWNIEVIERFEPPKQYSHPIGTQVWVRDVILQKKMTDWITRMAT